MLAKWRALTKKQRIALAVVVGVLVIMVLGTLTSGGQEQRTTSSAPASTPDPTATPVTLPILSAIDLYEEREENATRFDINRKGKRIHVYGVVDRIDSGNVYLVVDGFLDEVVLDDLPREVQAQANRDARFDAACTVGNFILFAMYLEDCESVPAS